MIQGGCGEQFRRRYIEGEKMPPGIALLIGGSCHSVNDANMTAKVKTGTLMNTSDLADLARDTFNKKWEEQPVVLNAEEKETGIKKTKGQATDMTITLTGLYHTELAPDICPDPTPRLNPEGEIIGYKGIERPFVVKCENYPFDLAGTIDITEIEQIHTDTRKPAETEIIIRDTKTAAQTPSQDKADNHDQFTCYGLGYTVIEGHRPTRYAYDGLVKLKKPKAVTVWTTRDAADFAIFMARFENACQTIEKEVYTPIGRDHWKCSAKFCGFFHTCHYAKGRLSMAVL